MLDSQSPSLIEAAKQRLAELWAQQSAPGESTPLDIPADIAGAIEAAVTSRTKTYRYVLPTQLLAKLVDPTLDCRSVQSQCGLTGAFDARSLCHKVIVPFDRANNNVLGGSGEPYVNNPLRIPAFAPAALAAQKDRVGFTSLCRVLDYAEENPRNVERLYVEVLRRIRHQLENTQVQFPAPRRLSKRQCEQALGGFLSERSGGARMQAVCTALFRTLGERLHLFSRVESANVNAADAATGRVADIECFGDDERIVFGAEVKDRELTLRQGEEKTANVREKRIAEFLFLVRAGVSPEEQPAVEERVQREFSQGHNLYIVEFLEFLGTCLVLLGEEGRSVLVQRVGEELNERRADLAHRCAWRDRLQRL